MKTMALEAESDALLLQPPQPPPPHPPPHPLPPSHIILSPEDRNRDGSFSEMFSLGLSLSRGEKGRKCEAILEISQQQQRPFPPQKLIESGNSKRTMNKAVMSFITLAHRELLASRRFL